jgi:succinate dehydrogenase / fumarate reductase cytochrome b subunit
MADSANNSELKKARPQFRNIGIAQISSYRLPWAGKVSILHRVSGAAMFLLLPFILYLFDKSISSEISFETFTSVLANPFVKLIILGLIWAYLHHFCAGIRYLMLDLHKGIDKVSAQQTAVAVLIVSLILTAVFGAKLFGLF